MTKMLYFGVTFLQPQFPEGGSKVHARKAKETTTHKQAKRLMMLCSTDDDSDQMHQPFLA